jgi:hypothetical protein
MTLDIRDKLKTVNPKTGLLAKSSRACSVEKVLLMEMTYSH